MAIPSAWQPEPPLTHHEPYVAAMLRFGVLAGGPVDGGRDWLGFARRVEQLGYDVLSLPNHLSAQPLAPFPALAAAAAVTERLHVGTLVIDNELVHPAVIANESATLDLLSDGRVELGIGAGWLPGDHEPIGQQWAPAGERIERLGEAIQVIRTMFAGGDGCFHGRHYSLEGAPVSERACPPILVGGGGRRVLTLAAQQADIVSLVPNMSAGRLGPESAATATGDATAEKLGWIAAARGDRAPVLHTNVTFVGVTGQREELLAKIGRGYGVDAAAAAEVPHALVGTIEEIATTVRDRAERLGITYLSVLAKDAETFAPVIALLRGAT
jgi:probable F420-dependent oxidoreductase